MADFPYTTVPSKLGSLLKKIHDVGVPDKATVKWLKSLGFKSSNDSSMLPVLKVIGFANGGGAPTEAWKHYRTKEHKQVLGEAIKDGYAELFKMYPDAATRSDEDLESFFSTRSSAGKQSIRQTVRTFKALATEATFGAMRAQRAAPKKTGGSSQNPSLNLVGEELLSQPEIHIDVQIHISPETTADQIEQIFKSMSKHLYGRN